MADDQCRTIKVRIDVIETNLQEISNQLKDILASLNLGGGNIMQQPPHDVVHVVIPDLVYELSPSSLSCPAR